MRNEKGNVELCEEFNFDRIYIGVNPLNCDVAAMSSGWNESNMQK